MTFGQLIYLAWDWIRGLWPLVIVDEWEQGVRMFKGRAVAQLGPGIHWFVPLLGDVLTEECNIEVVDTGLQTVGDLTFSMTLTYRVNNLMQRYKSIHEPTDSILNVVCAAASEVVQERGQLEPDEVRAKARQVLGRWGIGLLAVGVYSHTSAQALRLMMGED